MTLGSSSSGWGGSPMPRQQQRPRGLDPAAVASPPPPQQRGLHSSSSATAAAEADEQGEDAWQAETAAQLLAGGGTMALEARAALDYLQERVRC